MKKASDILGLLGAGLVILVAAAFAVVFAVGEAEAAFLWVILPAVVGSGVLVVAVMALVAVSYSSTRPMLSAVLYFVATLLGLFALWIAGLLLASGVLGHLAMLAVTPLLAAGILTYIDRDNRVPMAAS
jgi:hypothetical protein